jgi:hypothetical protein
MQYMLLIYEDETALAEPSAMQAAEAGHMRLAAEMREKGVWVAGAGLKRSVTATTVRLSGDTRTVHDGPYPETREHLGGFYMIDVPDLDAAIAWARQVPLTDGGGIEVRPLMYE